MSPVLIVDDNQEILDILEYHLSKSGYQVISALNSKDAMKLITKENICMAILDVMMPGEDGFSLCKKIREISNIPILFLTAKSCEDDKVKGFLCGGDDYILKPFSSKELLARVSALLRRCNVYQNKLVEHKDMCINNLYINRTTNYVMVNNINIDLTDIEYRILLYLVYNRGESISAQKIYEKIWREKFAPCSNNTVVVHIKNIRKKIQAYDSQLEYIHTVWGKGYAIY